MGTVIADAPLETVVADSPIAPVTPGKVTVACTTPVSGASTDSVMRAGDPS